MYSGACNEEAEAGPADSAELGIDAVGGVFLVLFIGIVSAFIIGIADFLWNCRQIAVDSKVPQSEVILAELKFVFNFSVTSKPVNNASRSNEECELEDFNEQKVKFSRQSSENLSTKLKNSLMNIHKIDKMFSKKEKS